MALYSSRKLPLSLPISISSSSPQARNTAARVHRVDGPQEPGYLAPVFTPEVEVYFIRRRPDFSISGIPRPLRSP